MTVSSRAFAVLAMLVGFCLPGPAFPQAQNGDRAAAAGAGSEPSAPTNSKDRKSVV